MNFSHRKQLIALTLFTALAVPAQVAAQEQQLAQTDGRRLQRYTVTFLGTLGGTFSQPFGMNNKGEVNGVSTLPGDQNAHAFLWRNGVMTDLGTLGGPNSNGDFGVPFGPNERGDVVGGAETANPDPLGEDFCVFFNNLTCLPFVWKDGVMTPLPTLGGNNGSAGDINNRGQVVGIAENTTPDPTCLSLAPPFNQFDQIQEKPVIWENGEIRELPTFPGDPDGGANAINDRGQIVGASGNCSKGPDYALHALLWQNGALTDLGNLGGTLFSFAGNINNRGQIIGASDLPSDTTAHAFLWAKDSGMQDLGTLPGDVSSLAKGINDKGQVVGQSCDVDGNCRAFLWQNGVMTDLNTLVPGDGSTLFLFEAFGINSRGQFTAIGFDANSGDCCAFLATPSNGEVSGESATAAARGETSQRPKFVLPENVRKMLRQRLNHRYHIPGLQSPSR
jgi:probable HAF family extracellular repeat protein